MVGSGIVGKIDREKSEPLVRSFVCSLVLFQRRAAVAPAFVRERERAYFLARNSLSLYVLSDPGAQLRYGGSGERFPGFVEYSARRRPRCRIPGRRCPRTVLRR